MNARNKVLLGFWIITCLFVNLVFAVAEECQGAVHLTFYYGTAANNTVSTNITGVENCDKFVGHLKSKDCGGAAICSFNMLPGGGVCSFPLPTTPGEYRYAACLDMNNNGKYEENEIGFQTIKINKNVCNSLGCLPSSWNECVCDESLKGTAKGKCMDNCGNELVYEKGCVCTELPSKQNATDTTGDQNKSSETTSDNQTLESNQTSESQTGSSQQKQAPIDMMTFYILGGALLLVIILLTVYFMITRKSRQGPQKPQTKDEPKMFGN